MNAYVVTSGCCSDYGIVGVFLDKGAAEKYIEAERAIHEYSEINDLEEYELDKIVPPETALFYVDSWGKVHAPLDTNHQEGVYPEEDQKRGRVYFRVNYNPDREVMLKAVYDKYAFFKAQKEGIA